MQKIKKLFNTAFAPDHPVAYLASGIKTYADFVADVAAVSQFYRRLESRRAALFCKRSYFFTVAFFGLLHAGKTLLMPPNLLDGTLEGLAGNFDFLVADDDVDQALTLHPSPTSFADLPVDQPALCLLTSGSTGERKFIYKSLGHLAAEITVLEKTFGPFLESTHIVATVSHQHIYGLLFRCLWPLLAGRPFEDMTHALPDTLHAAAQRLKSVTLVSSPALLRRLPEWGELKSLVAQVKTIFSSGGPLPAVTANIFYESLGHLPIEVLGSTETGGIAFRRQHTRENEWSTLDQVEIKVERQTLWVRSPWVSTSAEWFETGDGAELKSPSTFTLLGRRDRLLKLEEKRISLTEMEQHCLALEELKEVMIVPLERANGRQVLGCVAIAPNQSPALIAAKLKNHLAHFYEDALLPKHFRLVDAFPEDSQGKRSLEAFTALFEAEEQDPVILPQVIEQHFTSSTARLALVIPENLIYFKGHFPSHPIVPGFIQIDWVIQFARQRFAIESPLRKMESVKFLEIIQPGESIGLTLEYLSHRQEIIYTFANQTKTTGCGRLYF